MFEHAGSQLVEARVDILARIHPERPHKLEKGDDVVHVFVRVVARASELMRELRQQGVARLGVRGQNDIVVARAECHLERVTLLWLMRHFIRLARVWINHVCVPHQVAGAAPAVPPKDERGNGGASGERGGHACSRRSRDRATSRLFGS